MRGVISVLIYRISYARKPIVCEKARGASIRYVYVFFMFLYFGQELVREGHAQPREALARRIGIVHEAAREDLVRVRVRARVRVRLELWLEAAREDHCSVRPVRHDSVLRSKQSVV